jgi:hypothetical protein
MILICAKQEFSSNSSGNLLAAEYADAEDCCTGQFTITLIIPFIRCRALATRLEPAKIGAAVADNVRVWLDTTNTKCARRKRGVMTSAMCLVDGSVEAFPRVQFS